MAGQLPADGRLRRLRRLGLGVVALAAAAAAALASLAWRASRETASRYVVRPELSVQGVSAGSVVRLNGVSVGRVARVGLWSDPVSGRVRPEVVLALDSGLGDLTAGPSAGLRAQFIPVNPASGFLEVDLVWSPGSPRLTATDSADELPWQASAQQQAVAQAAPFIRRLAAQDLRAQVDVLLGNLGRVEARLADGPGSLAALSSRAARLRSAVERVERAAEPGALAEAQSRLGELREAVRVAESALDALDRELAAWPGESTESLREFSAVCRAAAARLGREVPADGGR